MTVSRWIAVALDILLLACAAIIAAIALTGGGAFVVGGARIRATSVGNPLAAAYVLAGVRLAFMRHVPCLGRPQLDLRHLDRHTVDAALRLRHRLNALDGRRVALVLLVVTGTSIVLRILNIVGHPGFFSGDDVELHEMTFGRLFGYAWPVWDLRSAFYPMTFLYPAQALAVRLGVVDTGTLVAIARLTVLALASLSIWLVYRIALRAGDTATALLAVVLFAGSRLHVWFGSSELPRPVAAVFVLGAYLLLDRGGTGRAYTAGALLAIGGCLRFGELIFFLPAAIHLAIERRRRDLVVAAAAGVVLSLAILGVVDLLYWGAPLASARRIVAFTVLEGQSSRGFQLPWYYLSSATDWTNYAVLALSLYALIVMEHRPALWGWIVVAAFSLLPHKEARYVIAAQPFLCVAAAGALWTLVGQARSDKARRTAFVATAALAGAVAFELAGWRFHRDDASIRVAQRIAATGPTTIVAEQAWRLGGHLYLRDATLAELAANDVVTAARERHPDWLLVLAPIDPATVARIHALGYGSDSTQAPYAVFHAVADPATESQGVVPLPRFISRTYDDGSVLSR